MPADAQWEVLALSLRVALAATLISLPLAVATALALARGRFVGRQVLNGLVHLPLVLPPVVTGYVLLVLFGRQGALGGWLAEIGIVFAFDWTGAALACGVMAFPLMVRAIWMALDAVDPGLEAAAATMGANRWQCFLRVTLPLIAPGIVTGALLAFAKAMGEFGATITFVSNIAGETRTLPLAIYTLLQVPGGEAAATRLVLISVAVAMLALLLSEAISRAVARRIGRG